MNKEFIIKETEKAIMVKGNFENIYLETKTQKIFWIPKKCLDENGHIALWFIRNKISELFNISGVEFRGLVKQN